MEKNMPWKRPVDDPDLQRVLMETFTKETLERAGDSGCTPISLIEAIAKALIVVWAGSLKPEANPEEAAKDLMTGLIRELASMRAFIEHQRAHGQSLTTPPS
jgi:hypothetical protein